MTVSPRSLATVALVALTLILWFSVAYESGRIPIKRALWANAPTIALGFIPLLLIVWQLRNGPDRLGLAVGIAFPVVVFALIALALFRMLTGNSEQALNFLGAVLMFMFSSSGFVIELIFLPTLGWLLLASIHGYAAISAGTGNQFLAGVLAATALAVVVPLKKWRPVARPEARPFTAHQSLHAFHLLYPCLWRIAGPDGSNGFPATLADLSGGDKGGQHPVCAGWRQYENETHTIEYRRQSSGFVLTISERARRGVPTVRLWVDETGIVRETVIDAAGREIEKDRTILNIDPLLHLLFLSAWIERYAEVNPEIGYPRQITGGASDQVIKGEVLRLISPFESRISDIPETSRLFAEGRTIVYTPTFDSAGRATTYSIAVLPRLPLEPDRQLGLHQFRSYLRDEDGVLHATGAPRAATRDDPIVPAEEHSVAAKRAEDWVRDRDAQAKFRAEMVIKPRSGAA